MCLLNIVHYHPASCSPSCLRKDSGGGWGREAAPKRHDCRSGWDNGSVLIQTVVRHLVMPALDKTFSFCFGWSGEELHYTVKFLLLPPLRWSVPLFELVNTVTKTETEVRRNVFMVTNVPGKMFNPFTATTIYVGGSGCFTHIPNGCSYQESVYIWQAYCCLLDGRTSICPHKFQPPPCAPLPSFPGSVLPLADLKLACQKLLGRGGGDQWTCIHWSPLPAGDPETMCKT